MIRYKKGRIKRPNKQDTYFYNQEKHNNEIFTFDTENSSGQHKGRITACKRELRKRMKARNK